MEYPIPIDEQMSGDREIQEREQDNKAHDSGEREPNHKTCEYAKPILDESGHSDELYCYYVNGELNFCGVPCPKTRGEE